MWNWKPACFIQRKEMDTYGIEISETGFQIAKEKLKSSLFSCELRNCRFPDDYFDVIVLNHVLEHFLSPLEEMEEIHRILKPNGIIYLAVPNSKTLQFTYTCENWYHLDIPRHLYHFSPDTLRRFLELKKFKLVSLNYPLFDFPLDFSQSLNAKVFKNRSNYS